MNEVKTNNNKLESGNTSKRNVLSRSIVGILNSNSVLLPVLFILLFFCFEGLITDWLYIFNKNWLSDCNEIVGGCAIILISAIITFRLIFNHRKTLLSLHHCLWIAFFIFIYQHYRHDLSFYFWSFIFKGKSVLYTDFLWIPIFTIALLQLVIIIQISTKKKNIKGLSRLEDDSPINETKEDILGYVNIIRILLSDINRLDLSKNSYSIGIAGEWGLGKSSFFHVLRNYIESEIDNNGPEADSYKDIVFVCFNPRSSSDVKDIQKDFFDTYAAVVAQYHSGIYKYIRYYQDALQLPDSNWLAKILKIFQLPDVNKGKSQINDIIRRIKKRFLIFIDDFDRLTGEEILEVMKVIDKNGDFVQTIFMTAYDKQYVNEVLEFYLGYKNKTNFTDKYFSYEILLPNQPKDKLKKYVKEVLSKKLETGNQDSKSKSEILEQWDSISNSILEYLPTLRHVKRFLNIFIGRYNIIRNEVDFVDFLRVSLLRYYDISTYHALAEGKLTREGNFMTSTSDKILYKASDFDVQLKSYSKWPGSPTILEKLLSEKVEGDYDLTKRYKHLCFRDSFPCYFYDYMPDGLFYKDLIQLYTAKTDDEAIKVLLSFIKYDENTHEYDLGCYTAVENFLRVRPLNELKTVADVKRFFSLLCYLYVFTRESINIHSTLFFMFTREAEKDLKHVMKDNYKQLLVEMVLTNIDRRPLSLARIILQINDNLIEDGSERDSVFTQREIQEYAELCQLNYLAPQNTITLSNYDSVVILSRIMTVENGKTVISKVVAERFIKFVTGHANDFVRCAIVVEKVRLETVKLKLYYRGQYNPSEIFIRCDVDIRKWLNDNVTDKDFIYLFTCLLNESNAPLIVDLEPENYEIDTNNRHLVCEVVKEAINSRNDLKVIGVIDALNSIEDISQHTGISVEEVKESIIRLKENGNLTPNKEKQLGLK